MRRIVFGYPYKRGAFDGKKLINGFLYGDALISAALIMLILPIMLSLFYLATLHVQKAMYWDHIVQDTVTYLEDGKSQYYTTGQIVTGELPSQFDTTNIGHVYYRTYIEYIDVQGVLVTQYRVDAIDIDRVVYSLCIFFEGKQDDTK